MELSFLVLGVAKNCQKTLCRTVAAISKLLPPMSSVSFFVVESDSTDGTVELMRNLREENVFFDFLSFGNLTLTEPDRICRITHCRNAYLDQLDQALSEGKSYDYVVVADFDGVNSKLQTLEPIDNLLSDSKIVCVNQTGSYYDILALRKTGWVDEDYRVTNRRGATEGTDPLLSHLRNVVRKQIKISRLSQNIEVESAFGGLAIYPVKAIAGLRYCPELLPTGDYECEHVSLNKQLRQRGYVIEIVPGLQNSGSRWHTVLTFLPLRFLAFVVGTIRGLFKVGQRG